jgi:hexosaminidase
MVVEMDMPGHTASIHHARPELVVGYAREPWTRYAAQPPAGQLRYMEDDATQFMVDLLGKLKAYIPSPYFATGGDEINENVYVSLKIVDNKEFRRLKSRLQYRRTMTDLERP